MVRQGGSDAIGSGRLPLRRIHEVVASGMAAGSKVSGMLEIEGDSRTPAAPISFA